MVDKIVSIEIGNEWRGCLMVSVNSGSRVPGSSPGGSHCVAFNVPHSTQVYSVYKGTSEFDARGKHAMDQHLIHEVV